MRIHSIVNLFRPDAVAAAKATMQTLRAKGIELGADLETAQAIDVPVVQPEDLSAADFFISFGGDGTLIRSSHICSERGTPILGVHFGRFGFVTQCMPSEIGSAISEILDGSVAIQERMMVQTELVRADRIIATLHSLNETVVQRAATTRVLTFDVKVNGRTLARYPADGVMIATPTGSTAYSLSAGGPVVDPELRAMLLTAIMPHTLSARPLMLRPEAVIDISIETRGDAVLSCDGHSRLHLLSGDAVRITTSPRVTRLVILDENDFFEKLAYRFEWSKGPKHEQ